MLIFVVNLRRLIQPEGRRLMLRSEVKRWCLNRSFWAQRINYLITLRVLDSRA